LTSSAYPPWLIPVGERGVGIAVRVEGAWAVLLLPVLAPAVPAVAHHGPHADAVAQLEPGDPIADRLHDPGDLVTGDLGIPLRTPILADLMDVRVADAAVADVHQDVVLPESPRQPVAWCLLRRRIG